MLDKDKQQNSEAENVKSASGTILGFMLFISGALLVLYGLIDIVVQLDSLKTAGYLVVGVSMYKIGHALLNHYAAFKAQPERRRALQR